MRRATLYRLVVVIVAIAILEVLCLTGVIDKITMQAPHLIVRDLYRMLVSGRMNGAIVKTLTNTLLALVLALGVGVVVAALLHRLRALRDTLDPLFATYYAVPVFAFYPFFIVVFGLSLGGRIKQVDGFDYDQFIVPGLVAMAMAHYRCLMDDGGGFFLY